MSSFESYSGALLTTSIELHVSAIACPLSSSSFLATGFHLLPNPGKDSYQCMMMHHHLNHQLQKWWFNVRPNKEPINQSIPINVEENPCEPQLAHKAYELDNGLSLSES